MFSLNKPKQRRKNGFTLIELLVVATILIVLSTIGIVSFSNTGKSARDGKRKADFETLRQALVLYRSDNSQYPADMSYGDMVIELGNGGYLSQPYPVDPKDSSPYVYSYSSPASGASFELTTQLESTGATYSVTNP